MPPHPGIILHEFAVPLGLSESELGRLLMLEEDEISKLMRGEIPVSANVALRLEHAFGPDADAEFWLRLQAEHDLARLRQSATQLA